MRRDHGWRCSTFVVIGLGLFASSTWADLPTTRPNEVGLDASKLAVIDDAVARAVPRDVPGAVVLVGRRGQIAHVTVAGRRAVVPHEEPMTRDTVFDLASLTKPIATTAAVLKLVERGADRARCPGRAVLARLRQPRQGSDHRRATPPAPLRPDRR